MHRNLKALGKLQTENQFRHEAFPLTDEQRDDIEPFEQTAHALSEVCDLQKIVTASRKMNAANLRNEAKSERAMLHAMFAPPKLSPETQAELDRRLGKKERTTKAAA